MFITRLDSFKKTPHRIEEQDIQLYFQIEWYLDVRMVQAIMTVLLMPEMLERIFGLLSRKDMKAAVAVCKWDLFLFQQECIFSWNISGSGALSALHLLSGPG